MRPALYLLLLFVVSGAGHATDELIVYSERQEPLIKPIFDTYAQETGVKIRYLTDSAPVLIERLAAEGDATRADLFMSVDAGNLWQAAQQGALPADIGVGREMVIE